MTSISDLYTDLEHTNGGGSEASYTIEHNIPLPTKRTKPPKEKKTRSTRFPFQQMQPTDSLFIPNTTNKKIAGTVQHARKAVVGSKWITRSMDGGVRVWRVE